MANRFKVGDEVLIFWEYGLFNNEEGRIIHVRDSSSNYPYEVAYGDTSGSFKEEWLKPVPPTGVIAWLSNK